MKLSKHEQVVELLKDAQPKSKCLHCHFAYYLAEKTIGCRMTGCHRHFKSCKYFVDYDKEQQRMWDCFDKGIDYIEPKF